MKRKTRKKENLTTVFLVILLALSIGYAYVSTQMNIKTKIGLDGNKWDVHFENIVIARDSVEAEEPPTSNNLTTTEIPYEVNLVKLGDFYEFDVDIVNSGSLDAMVDLATTKVYEINGNVETEIQLPKYLSVSVTYKNGEQVLKKHLLASGERTTITIKVVFRDDIDPIYFPSDSDKKIKFKTSITYVQADEYATEGYSSDTNCQKKITKILAAKDDYRNSEQSSTNLDIGLDNYCNVVNLDMWVSTEYCDGGDKAYNIINNDEIVLGFLSEYPCYSPATAEAQVVDGRIQTPIPAYILIDGESNFYPVTEIRYLFGNVNGRTSGINEIPELPNKIKTIGDYAFQYQNLEGNIVLPKTIESIGKGAFYHNNLTSVTFPSSATYFENQEYDYENSFDDGVTINHNY